MGVIKIAIITLYLPAAFGFVSPSIQSQHVVQQPLSKLQMAVTYKPACPVGSEGASKKTLDKTLDKNNSHRKISLLGSTGSIGTQTLEIVDERPEMFEVTALAAGSNVDLFAEQILKYRPNVAALQDESKIEQLKELLKAGGMSVKDMPEIIPGDEGIVAAAVEDEANVVVTGIVGCAGLLPTVEAIKKRKTIALANKETLISGGPAIVPLLEEYDVDMIPADSEHSAIFQCLQGMPPDGLQRIILTASGGAFRDWTREQMEQATVKDALNHPNWAMGAKITVDSATMMNKGLEVIEAHYLFGSKYEDIDIVVHPQSIIHSMVEAKDSSVIAQLGWADMRLPLLYSLSWPHRVEMPYKPLDLVELGSLTFKAPDHQKYPCIDLAYSAGRTGGTMPAVLNGANERANELFRAEKIGLWDIPRVIERTMEVHQGDSAAYRERPSLEEIVAVDVWAREQVDREIEKLRVSSTAEATGIA